MESKNAWIIAGVGIVCITTLEIIVIRNGINGTGLSLAIAGISGLAGFEIKHLINKVKENKK